MKIFENKELLLNKSKLDEMEIKVRKFLHETQLNAFLEEARKAEFKGNKKKALDQYKEALYFLRNDEIDDSLQAGKIKEIEKKISELET